MSSRIEDLWFALSELFVDNEINFKNIAKNIDGYDLDTIKFHLFYNVAPICSPNLEQTIPTIWSGFDKSELITNIKAYGIMNTNQITLKRKIKAFLYQLKYKNEWNQLKKYLQYD